MTPEEIAGMKYEEKEQVVEKILTDLDKQEIPVDRLVEQAALAKALMTSMKETLTAARKGLEEVFE